MYQRPEVRIIEPQQEQTTPIEVTNSEAASLLAKYGYKSPEFNLPAQNQVDNTNRDITMEDFIRMEKIELEKQREMEYQRRYGPKSITFDSNDIRYSNTEYRQLDDDNFGIQVQVVSDMPIYNNNRR
jgi:hypothetical protein